MGDKQSEGLGGDAAKPGLALLGSEAGREVPHQLRDVVAPFAQRRHAG